tara:strand:- start:354 stop:572 length:219 start_codon:yes stop_codon:yes gene_type:complete
MSQKHRIDEGLAKVIFRWIFKSSQLDKKIMRDPEVKRELKKIAKHAQNFNEGLQELEKLTGQDYSHIKFKRR